MMLKNIFFTAVLLTAGLYHSFCQQEDSLRNIFSDQSRPYETRIKACLELLGRYQNKNFDDIIETGSTALSLARKNADSLSVGILQRLIGSACYFTGKYDLAAEDYYQSVSVLEKTGNRKELALTYNELAKLYRKTHDLDRALDNYQKAYEIFTSIKDSTGISTILNESGVVFEYKEEYKEAIRRYQSSLEIARSLGDSVGVSYSLNFIAGVYTIQKKYELAEAYLQQVIRIREALKDSFGLALAYTDLGVTLKEKGDYARAEKYLQDANHTAAVLHYPDFQASVLLELSSLKEQQGQPGEALKYYQQRTALRDSVFSIEKTKQIEELDAKYETEKKERLIQTQQFNLARQRYLIAGISLLLLSGLAIAILYYRRYKLKQAAKLQAEIMKHQELSTKAVMEAEESERQRIAKDLHDGVGQMMSAARMNLSAFESEIKLQDPSQKLSFEKIIALVDESCREVRSVSHNMMPNALLKKSLAAAVREFIEKLDNKILQVHLHTEGLDEKLDSNVETVLYRVIQECVNNVIKHSGASHLDISIIRDKDGISATVEDNGKGFDSTKKDIFEGLGLKNIRTRTEYLKGTVDFDSMPGKGTLVAIHVPLT